MNFELRTPNYIYMDQCIFCKIIKKEIPNYTVYEDDHVVAFLDVAPRVKGHTVVIPKLHTETLLELNDELLGFLMTAVKRVQEKIDHVLHPDGYNVGWNHGLAGGQAIPHLHIHVMPRWNDDGGSNMHAIVNAPGDKTVGEIAKLFFIT